MARLARLYAPELPHLVQARFALPLGPAEHGNELLDCLAVWLADESRAHHVVVHGWALTFDQLLLLATPAGPTGLSSLLQALGRRLAARLRTGRVFAGRFRSTLVEPGAWVLPALIWLETLPLRQGLVADAEHWHWSSAAVHVGAAVHDMVGDHGDYWACGNTPFDRQANYRTRLLDGLPSVQARRIEQAVQGQWALGSDDFVAGLAARASRRPAAAKRGRPRKEEAPVPPTSPLE